MDLTYQQHIGGQWLAASNAGIWNVLNPATEEVVRQVPFGNGVDCRLALEAASRAFPSWSTQTPYVRAAILRRVADLIRERAESLAHTTVLESGKPMIQARGEWTVAADLFEWFAEEGKRAYGRVIPSRNPARRLTVLHRPIGVVGVITAWNFPVYNIARAAAAALAAGCTVVLRPSEYTPLTAMDLVNLLLEAGMPEGVVNLINGDPAAMGQEMLDNPVCAKIHFTGSQRVGRLLMDGASRTITRLSLELGGNAPVLIFPDADLDKVIPGAITAKFRNAGQVCVSPQRFFVHESIFDTFAERITAAAQALVLGSGLDATTQVGPLINAHQRDRMEEMIAQSTSAGAQLLTGGRRPASMPRGYFYEPTVLTHVALEAPVFAQEIFGPVLPLRPFRDLADVLAEANSTRHGLAAYVWTNHLGTAQQAVEGLHFGLIGLNDWAPQATEGPFSGHKESGIGRESGREGLEEYLETTLVASGL